MGRPQCTASDRVHGYSIIVRPGEIFQIIVVVGADLGTTIGVVYAILFRNPDDFKLKPVGQYAQWINNNQGCSSFYYTVYSFKKQGFFYLAVQDESLITVECYFLKGLHYKWHENASKDILYMPPLVNITLLPCPPGFILQGEPPGCNCFPVLTKNNVHCIFANGRGYHSWNAMGLCGLI